ncbi:MULTISPECIES: hypothetical protein [unclassified Aureispira]|uniref:hypothetical protein n=1 Tax=unclassified Aureispira TaxID=2649989 RepID=UPI00069612DB|nr:MULTISPECIES: hypothetical protein [unclassified Aureispira]WMX12918.1 hypothetical protein QP953_18945 [Aureispira sp. CCB-E]
MVNKAYLKLLFSLLIIGTLGKSVRAQAIHDAFKLHEFVDYDTYGLYDLEDVETFYEILARNFSTVQSGLTYDEIVDAYRDNPFIAPMLTDLLGGDVVFSGKTGQRAIGDLASASTGLGLPGSTFLMGLTDFLVKRTKQELSIAFFRDFQKIVQRSEEMQFLFPTTTKVLLKIDENIYQFKAFWEVLRESFLADLEDLVYNLEDYVQQSSRIKNTVVRHMMSDFFKVIELFYDKTTPSDIINYLADDAYLHTITPEVDSSKFVPVLQSSLQVLGLLSKSLENKDDNGYWVEPEKVTKMLQNPIITTLYLGLIYQQGKDIQMGEKTFAEYLAPLSVRENAPRVRRLLNTFKAFLDKTKALERLAKDMRRKANDRRRDRNAAPMTDADKELEYDEYYDFTQNICDLLLYTYEFKKEILGATSKEDSIVYRYMTIVGDINGMALEVRKKHYTSALINTLFIIEKLLPEGQFACERQVMLKYGTFIATAVKAKTAEEVSDVISAFALPPGGSAIKKYSKFSIALNAYVGLSAGQEILDNVGANPYYAVATPIGVTFNWGFKNYGSISLLASVLDIGALTAFRFEDDNVSELPDLKFENVLAPGGYLVYGVPKYPISIGVGAQLGPNLRTVTNGNLQTQTSGWRWGAFIAVDIPIVSIYTTNKNYKQCCRKCEKQAKNKPVRF